VGRVGDVSRRGAYLYYHRVQVGSECVLLAKRGYVISHRVGHIVLMEDTSASWAFFSTPFLTDVYSD